MFINFEILLLENIIRKLRFRKEYLLKIRLIILERIILNLSYYYYLKEDFEVVFFEDVVMIVMFDFIM